MFWGGGEGQMHKWRVNETPVVIVPLVNRIRVNLAILYGGENEENGRLLKCNFRGKKGNIWGQMKNWRESRCTDVGSKKPLISLALCFVVFLLSWSTVLISLLTKFSANLSWVKKSQSYTNTVATSWELLGANFYATESTQEVKSYKLMDGHYTQFCSVSTIQWHDGC